MAGPSEINLRLEQLIQSQSVFLQEMRASFRRLESGHKFNEGDRLLGPHPHSDSITATDSHFNRVLEDSEAFKSPHGVPALGALHASGNSISGDIILKNSAHKVFDKMPQPISSCNVTRLASKMITSQSENGGATVISSHEEDINLVGVGSCGDICCLDGNDTEVGLANFYGISAQEHRNAFITDNHVHHSLDESEVTLHNDKQEHKVVDILVLDEVGEISVPGHNSNLFSAFSFEMGFDGFRRNKVRNVDYTLEMSLVEPLYSIPHSYQMVFIVASSMGMQGNGSEQEPDQPMVLSWFVGIACLVHITIGVTTYGFPQFMVFDRGKMVCSAVLF